MSMVALTKSRHAFATGETRVSGQKKAPREAGLFESIAESNLSFEVVDHRLLRLVHGLKHCREDVHDTLLLLIHILQLHGVHLCEVTK